MVTWTDIRDRVKRFHHANPRRSVWIGLGALAAIGLVVALVSQLGLRWERYQLEAVGVSVDLPAVPEVSDAGLQGEAGLIYEVRTKALSVLISGGNVPAGAPVSSNFMVGQSMAFVEATPEITDLEYEITTKMVEGRRCLQVSGVFLRGGQPARLNGVYFVGQKKHGHVLCFYSDVDGARMADRVLTSSRFSETL